jgi:hypothetical protein
MEKKAILASVTDGRKKLSESMNGDGHGLSGRHRHRIYSGIP